jgi:hypothetical protein
MVVDTSATGALRISCAEPDNTMVHPLPSNSSVSGSVTLELMQ